MNAPSRTMRVGRAVRRAGLAALVATTLTGCTPDPLGIVALTRHDGEIVAEVRMCEDPALALRIDEARGTSDDSTARQTDDTHDPLSESRPPGAPLFNVPADKPHASTASIVIGPEILDAMDPATVYTVSATSDASGLAYAPDVSRDDLEKLDEGDFLRVRWSEARQESVHVIRTKAEFEKEAVDFCATR
ncbi:hypothetical protein GCM10027059_45140 [Myceligenerans halotolerans]